MSRHHMVMILLLSVPLHIAWDADAPALDAAKILLDEVKAINKIFVHADCDTLIEQLRAYDGTTYREVAPVVESQYRIHEGEPEFGEPALITTIRDATAETGRVVSRAGQRCKGHEGFSGALMGLMKELDYRPGASARTPIRVLSTAERKQRKATLTLNAMRTHLLAATLQHGSAPADLTAAQHAFETASGMAWPGHDPWGHPYVYSRNLDRVSFRIFSVGPDGKAASADDLFPRGPGADAAFVKDTLTKRDVLDGIRKHTDAIQRCGRDAGITPTITVRFKIHPTGAPTHIHIATAEYRRTSLGTCLTKVIQRMRFPAHNALPVAVTYPFELR